MVPNPIYSGNPIYDEIADPSLLKFLKKSDSGSQSRDESYVEIAGNPVSAFRALPPSDMNKLVNNKQATISVSYSFI